MEPEKKYDFENSDITPKKDNSFVKGLALGIGIAMSVSIICILLLITGLDLVNGKFDDPSQPAVTPTSAADNGSITPAPTGATMTATPTPTKVPSNATMPKTDIFESVTNAELLSKIKEIKDYIDTYSLYGASDEEQANAVISGILNSLNDKYAAYYTVDNMAKQAESTSGTYCGIGALVSQDVKTMVITVVRPFEGGPAYKVGMHKGDIIVKVDQLDVTRMEINEVVTYMKGEPDTNVDITVNRDGEEIVFHITRAKIEVPTVEYEMMDNNIGYIQVTEFDQITVDQFYNAVSALEKQQMKGLVIDLRDNPGGLVSSCVSLVDRIVPTGVVVYTEDKDGKRSYEYATTAKELKIPIVVLINGNSASASEIFCGALRDYGKATIMGTTSYGKGIVQVITYLSDKSGLKFTISQYFTPKGYAVHGVGIAPDIEVELDEELKTLSEIPKEKDNQLQAAIKELLKQIGQ